MSNAILPEYVGLQKKDEERRKELDKRGTTKGKFFIQQSTNSQHYSTEQGWQKTANPLYVKELKYRDERDKFLFEKKRKEKVLQQKVIRERMEKMEKQKAKELKKQNEIIG